MRAPWRSCGTSIVLLLCHALDVGATLPDAATWGSFADGSRLLGRVRPHAGVLRESERRDSLHSWDALAYHVDLSLDLSPPWLEAAVGIRGVARENLVSLDLHLRGYTLDQVEVNGLARAASRQDDQLLLDLAAQPLAAGDTFQVNLGYGGTPVAQDGVGLFVSPSLAYSLSDPWGTRNWIACFDEPFDKATWSIAVRADSSLTTLSNGELTGVTGHGDGTRTWAYRHDAPMSSYLASIVTGHLAVLEDDWQGLPLRWFVYPQHQAQAWQAVSHMDQMLDCFTGLWGDYPFAGYAMGEAPIYGGLGGMEHQTCTTIGNGIIAAGLQYESVIAHELSHMWWGDAVTPVDYRHVWLNEGWATYAEALFYQHLAGGDEQAFLDYLRQIHLTYLNWDSQYLPIYDPPQDDLFNISQYEKAASVLHMLRDLMGDAAFAQAQRDWLAAHRFGTVDSREYQAAMEAASGQDLEWFFQQWIYSGGYPTYTTVSEARQGDAVCWVHLTVGQSHQRLPQFRARVPVRVLSSLMTLDTLLWIEEPSQQFSWVLPGDFDTLIFNADETVLCRHVIVPPLQEAPQWRLRSFAIDDGAGGNGDGDLAPGESGLLSLELENVGGWDTGVQFQLSSDDVELSGNWEPVADAGGGAVIHLPAGPVQVSGWAGPGMGYAELVLNSSSDSYESQSLALRLPMGDPWLLLATRASQADLAPFLRQELDSLEIFSDLLITDNEPLPPSLLPDHRALIWLGGDSGQTLAPAEQDWLAGCFQSQAAGLLVTGQDIIDPVADPWGGIAIRALTMDVPEVRVDGEPGTLDGLSALLIGAGGAMNQTTPSSLQGEGCQVLARYHNSGEPALLAQEGPGGGRLVVAGFGPEAISGMAGTSPRRQWLARLLELLDADTDMSPTVHQAPMSLTLGAPWPNPCNPMAEFHYELARPGFVRLLVHDIRGQRVHRTELGRQEAGSHRFVLHVDGFTSGLYFTTVQSGGESATRRLLVVK